MGMTRSSHRGREVEQHSSSAREVIGVDEAATLAGCLVFEPLSPACSCSQHKGAAGSFWRLSFSLRL